MLDELLGRAELKERVAGLEEERESLAAQLEAERERRASATSERQEAERQVNRLEDRIAELEDRVERAEAAEDAGPSYRRRERLTADRTASVLDRLRSLRAGPEGALTAWIDGANGPAGGGPSSQRVPPGAAELLGDRARLAADAGPCLLCADDAGLLAVGLRPPLVDAARSAAGGEWTDGARWDEGFALDRSWFLPAARGRYALAVVRSDVFAMGIYDGDERVDVRGFASDVKGDHSKGGFSQGRFERRRDAQIDEHVADARAVLADAPRPLYLVGERSVVGELADLATATATADATGDPETALRAAHTDFWRTRLWVL